jgi:hypothetical protein
LILAFQESLNYDHPTVNFYDIDQELFDVPNPSRTTQRKLHSTTLLVDDGDDGEAIDDEDSPQWMDNKLGDIVGEEDFGLPEADIDLDAPELEEILADAPRVLKGVAKAVETVVEDDEVAEDEDAVLNWGA